jgi:hypothetical protein
MEKLNCRWVFWYHFDINNWVPESFKKIAVIDSVDDFWDVINELKNNILMIEHMYFMREGIYPMWEDEMNRNGGCWSIKIDIKDSYSTLIKTLIYTLGENLLYKDKVNISYEITGISLCQKNNYNCVLQIWTSNNKNNKVNYLNKGITEQHGYEIIYRPHIAEW